MGTPGLLLWCLSPLLPAMLVPEGSEKGCPAGTGGCCVPFRAAI